MTWSISGQVGGWPARIGGLSSSCRRSSADRASAGLLQLFFGWFGLGRFYIGSPIIGVIQLLLGLIGIFTLFVFVGLFILIQLNQVLVGHQACLGHGGGHTTWTCRTCDQTVYGPPLNTHCTALDGPATVRISNRRN